MGIPLERAARDTDLRATYLAALERDDAESLGLDPSYIRGTLRTYADYLGLDSRALVARHRAGGAPGRDSAAVADPVSGPKAPWAVVSRAKRDEQVSRPAKPVRRVFRARTREDFTDHRSLTFRVARVVVSVVVLAIVAVVAFALGQALAQGTLLPTLAGWVDAVSAQVSAQWPLSWSP